MGSIIHGGIQNDNSCFVAADVNDSSQQTIWFGIKAGSSGYTNASLHGTYNIVEYLAKTSGIYSCFCRMTFDGHGLCMVKQVINHASAANQSNEGIGTYEMSDDGNFTLTYNGETVKGFMSFDGAELIISGVEDVEAQSIGFGVKAVDDDHDGASNVEELEAPNSGDANNDGILDSQQEIVASLPSLATGEYCSIDTNLTGNNSVIADAITTSPDALGSDLFYDHPYGLVGFTLSDMSPAGSEQVRVYFYGADDLSGCAYRWVDQQTGEWLTLPGVSFGTESIDGAMVPFAEFTLTDGTLVDADGSINGIINGFLGGPALSKYRLGDMDRNDAVDGFDLASFIATFGSSSGMSEYRSEADLNSDGIIDGADLEQFGREFGR